MKLLRTAVTAASILAAASSFAGKLTARIAEDCRIIATDNFAGGERTRFDFHGYVAWVVEPTAPEAAGRPWTWTMQWAEAFVPRTPVSKLLSKGFHHVTIMTFSNKMDRAGLEISRKFQRYLVERLNFAPKTRLIGMSWGGFFSIRYSATYPDAVKSIYLDAPLLTFGKFRPPSPWKELAPANGKWPEDPRMPVNMAGPVARAGIPILLLYGGHDLIVNPKENSETFAARFKEAGGNIKTVLRGAYGHHPHGVELDDWSTADFFLAN